MFRTGRRVEGLYLQLIVTSGRGRAGYVVGRKVAPRAVDRNRIRRKLREAVRALRAGLAGYDVVVRVKRAGNRADQDAAANEARRLLAELTVRLA